jgi:hypothetical protein
MQFDDETPPMHCMTYAEREALKKFARTGQDLEQALVMISHWMSCSQDVSFSAYAANWVAAQATADVPSMHQYWPLKAPRMIADNSTAWGSYLAQT